jgi:hypothetical protein
MGLVPTRKFMESFEVDFTPANTQYHGA